MFIYCLNYSIFSYTMNKKYFTPYTVTANKCNFKTLKSVIKSVQQINKFIPLTVKPVTKSKTNIAQGDQFT